MNANAGRLAAQILIGSSLISFSPMAAAQDSDRSANKVVQAAPGPGEVSRVLFSASQSLRCKSSGFCAAKFPKVGLKKRLEITHVRCWIRVSGGFAYEAFFTGLGATVDLGLVWERGSGESPTYTFAAETNAFVPSGSSYTAHIRIDGTPEGPYCGVWGELVTLR